MGFILKTPGQRKKALSPKKTVLFCLVDWQKFFVDPGSPAFIPDTVRIKENVAELLRLFVESGYLIAVTQHSNPESTPNSFIRFYGRVLSKKSRWFELAEPAAGLKNAIIFYKKTYSVFANQKFTAFLKARSIETVVLAGVQTNKCILASALSGFDLGYEVIIAAEACASRSRFRHRAALNLMKTSCALVLKTDELIELVKP